MKRKIRASSFDFDNCIFHTQYFWKQSKPDIYEVILKNIPFFENIRSQNHAYDANICLIGSNRQSKRCDDQLSAFKKAPTESCFSAIQKVNDFLDATLDPFLLADIYGNLDSGQSFERALSPEANSIRHADWIFDSSKLSILYAQMHKIANDYPDDIITFDFYDDKSQRKLSQYSLLEDLQAYFTAYSEMIPHNVTLRLNYYAGKEVTTYTPIQGTGRIDAHYHETVREMAHIATANKPQATMYSFIHSVLPQHLSRIKLTARHGYPNLFNPFKPSFETGADANRLRMEQKHS